MRLIKELSEAIKDEVEGVEFYAKLALETKPLYPQLSYKLYEIANAEYGHASTLHEHVVKLVKDMQSEGAEPTQEMLNKWDEHHREFVEKMQKAQSYLGMYKK